MGKAETQSAIDAQVAAFLAKGGKVQQVPEGTNATASSYTDSQMRSAENQVHVRNPYYR